MVSKANFDVIRTLGFGGISGAYADVGGVTTEQVRAVCFTNDTEGDVYFTTDTSQDEIFVKSQSFKLWDLQSNINPQFDDKFVLPIGTQFSVKQITAPTSGAVYVECVF